MEWAKLVAVLLLLGHPWAAVSFKCKDGRGSIFDDKACDGTTHCADGSDEYSVTCDAITNARPLAVGQQIAVQVDHTERGLGTDTTFKLCSAVSCSQVKVFGAGDGGEPWYNSFTGCNHMGKITTCNHSGGIMPDGFRDFPLGMLEFVVERGPRELSVWRQGFPHYKMTVPAQADQGLLRITYSGSLLGVAYKDAIDPCARCSIANNDVYEMCRHNPHDRGDFAMRKGVQTVVGPEERVTEEVLCDEGHYTCELGMERVKSYSTETVWSQEAGVTGSVEMGVNFMAVATATVGLSLSVTHSHGWTNETSDTTSFSCGVLGGFVGWMTVKPEFFVKGLDVFQNGTCNTRMLEVKVPRIRKDGSIAGRRSCRTRRINPSDRR